MSYYEQSELACKGERLRSNKIAKERMRSIHFCKLCLQKKEKQSIARLLYLFRFKLQWLITRSERASTKYLQNRDADKKDLPRNQERTLFCVKHKKNPQIALWIFGSLAMSYLPGPSPVKYFQR